MTHPKQPDATNIINTAAAERDREIRGGEELKRVAHPGSVRRAVQGSRDRAGTALLAQMGPGADRYDLNTMDRPEDKDNLLSKPLEERSGIAGNPDAEADLLYALADDQNVTVLRKLAQNQGIDERTVNTLLQKNDTLVIAFLTHNKAVKAHQYSALFEACRRTSVGHPHFQQFLSMIVRDEDTPVSMMKTVYSLLDEYSFYEEEAYKDFLANPNTPKVIIEAIVREACHRSRQYRNNYLVNLVAKSSNTPWDSKEAVIKEGKRLSGD